jgi:hypothetical protein
MLTLTAFFLAVAFPPETSAYAEAGDDCGAQARTR